MRIARRYVRRWPWHDLHPAYLADSPYLRNPQHGCEIDLKKQEKRRHTGSCKPRGASNQIATLEEIMRKMGSIVDPPTQQFADLLAK